MDHLNVCIQSFIVGTVHFLRLFQLVSPGPLSHNTLPSIAQNLQKHIWSPNLVISACTLQLPHKKKPSAPWTLARRTTHFVYYGHTFCCFSQLYICYRILLPLLRCIIILPWRTHYLLFTISVDSMLQLPAIHNLKFSSNWNILLIYT